jgi:CHAD domain-containing protein
VTEEIAAGDPEEIELKFDVLRTAPARRLVEADDLAGLRAIGPSRVVLMEDTYVDTASGRVRAARWAARFRRIDGTTTVNVKGLARRGAGATHRRSELEGLADPTLPPAAWPPSAARDRLIEIVGEEPLGPLVTIEQRRRQRDFANDQVAVEVSLDRVVTRADGRVADRSNVLEVELRSGDSEELARVRNDLAQRPFLAEATTSKLARAEAAAQRLRIERSQPRLETGPTPGVTADDSMSVAGRKVLRFHLARVLAREPGVRAGIDPEELHKMRVATRRLRAGWRVFGDAFRGAKVRRLRDDLGVVASKLGATRDLDVQLERLTNPRREDLGSLEVAWRVKREAARAALVKELDSARHRRWLTSFIRFVETDDAGVGPTLGVEPTTVRERAGSQIWAAYERVRAFERMVGSAPPETLHRLRIEAKRLRYSIEFVREALAPEAADAIERVTALQDHLGLLNDADVAAAMTREFLAESGESLTPAQSAAVADYLAEQERLVVELSACVGPPWTAVTSPAFRRGLGRVLAEL